ncbi:MAG: HU family DNA-binding protein [Azoarcus sp.]|jgi:DNA-binding protein HU-beta|nr:HU family DNA-binding protein [Azoarcus sp.]
MNKGEFVEVLADRLDIPRAQAERALTGVLEIVSEELVKGEKIAFTGFGSFEVSDRAARTGRNPQTGATIKIAASKVPKFSAGATLKAAVNESKAASKGKAKR